MTDRVPKFKAGDQVRRIDNDLRPAVYLEDERPIKAVETHSDLEQKNKVMENFSDLYDIVEISMIAINGEPHCRVRQAEGDEEDIIPEDALVLARGDQVQLIGGSGRSLLAPSQSPLSKSLNG